MESIKNTFGLSPVVLNLLVRDLKQVDQAFQKIAADREKLAKQIWEICCAGEGRQWNDDSWNEVIEFVKDFESKQQVGPTCPPVATRH
jgi:hypothetical protein